MSTFFNWRSSQIYIIPIYSLRYDLYMLQDVTYYASLLLVTSDTEW